MQQTQATYYAGQSPAYMDDAYIIGVSSLRSLLGQPGNRIDTALVA